MEHLSAKSDKLCTLTFAYLSYSFHNYYQYCHYDVNQVAPVVCNATALSAPFYDVTVEKVITTIHY